MPDSWDNYAPSYRPATEADIFAAFEAAAKSCGFYDVKNAKHPFNPDMSLHNWLVELDEFYNGPLQYGLTHDWLNETYQTQIEKQAWEEFTSHSMQVTIGEICRFIVEHGAVVMAPKPLRVAGRDCDEAGAFLTFSASLTQETDGGERLTPSTPIDQAARVDSERFRQLLFRACPHLSDKYHIFASWPSTVLFATWVFIWVLGAASYVSYIYGYPIIGVWTWAASNIFVFTSLLATVRLPPRRIEIKGIETMADLSREIVKYQRQLSML